MITEVKLSHAYKLELLFQIVNCVSMSVELCKSSQPLLRVCYWESVVESLLLSLPEYRNTVWFCFVVNALVSCVRNPRIQLLSYVFSWLFLPLFMHSSSFCYCQVFIVIVCHYCCAAIEFFWANR